MKMVGHQTMCDPFWSLNISHLDGALHQGLIHFVWFMLTSNVPTVTMHFKAGKEGVQILLVTE